MSFKRFFILRSVNMLIILFSSLLLTLFLMGSTMDNIIKESIRFNVVNQFNDQLLNFKNLEERQRYLQTQIDNELRNQGLNEPWYSPKRIINSLAKIMTLDLGRSTYFTSESGSASIREIILEKLPKTVLLFTTSTIMVAVIGIFVGLFISGKRSSIYEKIVSAFAVLSNSFPGWWIAMIMIFIFAFTYQIFPARSTPLTSPEDPSYITDLLYHMTLPLITLVLLGISVWAYFVKYFVSDILREDFITAKRIMGIPERKIMYSHALRNAAPPIITVLAFSLAASFSGGLIIEAVFDWPGLGKLYFDAIAVMDIPLILGISYMTIIIFLVTVFVTDILYGYFDPRVKL